MNQTEIDLKKFAINDSFWSPRQELVSKVVIPYQEKVLNDEIPGVEKSHAIANFRIAAGLEEGEFYGMVFQDSDLAKWLEGVAYSLAISPDAGLEKRADAVIDLIERAQQPDGYLDTYFIIKEPDHKFQNLQECHELYCAGHMMEAAVAYYEATGKDKLLQVMQREADCIDRHIGPEEGKIHGVPGHEEVEIGLLRMYRATGNEKDLALAEYFLNERGQNPNYFQEEKEGRGWYHWNNDPVDADYTQTFAPVREQKEARGHSVRAMYLYTAMADYAGIKGDVLMAEACRRLWTNTTERQMYVTGGLGQVAKWEGFSHDYDLPNDTAYAETCASIGLVMFARKMLELEKDSKYADVMERALYNGVLSGMQLDGKRFFYVNPLEVVPGVSGKLPGYEHVLPQRPEWFPCACCPPNVVRLLTSLGKYALEESEDVIYSHLFVGGRAELTNATLQVKSSWPWKGDVSYEIESCKEKEFTLAVRIPDYVRGTDHKNGNGTGGYCLTLNGAELPAAAYMLEKGYAYVTRMWKAGDRLEFHAELLPKRIYSNPKVRANANCAAIMKGPVVYCIEGADNEGVLASLRLPRQAVLRTEGSPAKLPAELDCIRAEGTRLVFDNDDLYGEEPPKEKAATITAIPYFAWGNRGENEMRVWIQEKS